MLPPIATLTMDSSPDAVHVQLPFPTAGEIARLPKDGGTEFNRLIFEPSPYLLQHARNPVDWYPWGEEAFAKAKREDKPVFLSIGYATCHWCHVMERESFEDDEVGKFLSERYVPIKVDREERPDIDHVYMTVTQAMSGSGGWPMTVILTPEKKPFFAGTYFPKHDRMGRTGLLTILHSIDRLWSTDRAQILAQGEKVAEFLRRQVAVPSSQVPGVESIHAGYAHFSRAYDDERGGFGRAPKFPMAHSLSFLLRYHRRAGEARALEMVERTLRAMRMGGIYDQIGWGTHRYSTDGEWLVPHFEKMLYDQALLVTANLEAFQVTKDQWFAQTAREILHYVRRDMTSPEGGFFSAEDADSEGEEGKFYVWDPAELQQVLGPEDGALFAKIFEIRPGGNFRDEVRGVTTGQSIPHLRKPLAEWSKELGRLLPELTARLDRMREKLFRDRENRIHPLKDDKILTDWNGLMISAFAKAAQVLDDPAYLEAGNKAADFVLKRLCREDGRLLKRFRAGQAGLPAHLEDYAFVVAGLLDLYEAGFNLRYLQEAIRLTNVMIEHFWDPEGGGFFMTADDSEELLVRTKSISGGAIPSGNSVAALNLARLYGITGRSEYREMAEKIGKAFGQELEQYPGALPEALSALDFLIGPTQEIVIAGDRDDPVVRDMLRVVREQFLPNKVILHRPLGDAPSGLVALAPYVAMQTALDGKATAYVCESFRCRSPVGTVDELRELLRSGDLRLTREPGRRSPAGKSPRGEQDNRAD